MRTRPKHSTICLALLPHDKVGRAEGTHLQGGGRRPWAVWQFP